MRQLRLAIAVAMIAAPIAPSAIANDATAEIGVGGLQMVYNSAIAVVSEDLYISPDEVQIAYRVRNISDQPVTVLVAFPLPPLGGTYDEIWYELPNPVGENYVNFTIAVNGKTVVPSVFSRATAFGIDRTEDLIAAGVPLNPASYELGEILRELPDATIEGLRRLGLLVVEEWGVLPTWQLETSFYWETTFPVGEDVIVEHRYEPVVGYGFFGGFLFDDPDYLDRYCMDDSFIGAASRLMAADLEFPQLDERRIRYLLTPAANWATPIETFHLTIDKGDPNALVSFCGTGVTRTSPTTFELTATDFFPTRELDILIVDAILN
ncbi:MAG: DUF4424 family protein [Alphaproteobacteria bacterium]